MGTSPGRQEMIAIEVIARRILVLRGHRVMLDRDLAEPYRVETRVLNQAVKRNAERFPEDFMFELSLEEARAVRALRSQSVTLEARPGTQSTRRTWSPSTARSCLPTFSRALARFRRVFNWCVRLCIAADAAAQANELSDCASIS